MNTFWLSGHASSAVQPLVSHQGDWQVKVLRDFLAYSVLNTEAQINHLTPVDAADNSQHWGLGVELDLSKFWFSFSLFVLYFVCPCQKRCIFPKSDGSTFHGSNQDSLFAVLENNVVFFYVIILSTLDSFSWISTVTNLLHICVLEIKTSLLREYCAALSIWECIYSMAYFCTWQILL